MFTKWHKNGKVSTKRKWEDQWTTISKAAVKRIEEAKRRALKIREDYHMVRKKVAVPAGRKIVFDAEGKRKSRQDYHMVEMYVYELKKDS